MDNDTDTDVVFIAYLQGYEAGRDALKVERNRYKAERDALKDEVEFAISTLRDIQSIAPDKYYMVDAAINHFLDALTKIKEG